MSNETVSIADAFADAVRVQAQDVRVGDYVFGTTGRRDRVIRVAHKRRTTITPEHLWPLVCDLDETVTIVRGDRER